MPDFNFLGFTDLDILDFWTGAAERGFNQDVRKSWKYCYKEFSTRDSIDRMETYGIFKFLSSEFWKFALGFDGDDATEAILPADCKEVGDQIDKMGLWIRAHLITFAVPIWMLINAIMNFSREFADLMDLFTKISLHDFYNLGYDFADILLNVAEGKDFMTMHGNY